MKNVYAYDCVYVSVYLTVCVCTCLLQCVITPMFSRVYGVRIYQIRFSPSLQQYTSSTIRIHHHPTPILSLKKTTFYLLLQLQISFAQQTWAKLDKFNNINTLFQHDYLHKNGYCDARNKYIYKCRIDNIF